ncbi:MAG: hypothetical protein J7K88_11205 [Candidatus Fermentibacteraceae bacterium]|nr:hypothetical protein [Candidatus Fermentibacteraceae bacterium]
MKRIALFVTVIVTVIVLSAGCGTTGPSISSEFPAFILQAVDTGGPPTACDFLGGSGDGLAVAGTYMYFVDRDAGYVKAEVSLGAPLADVGSSPEGGYGLAVGGNILYVVSNEIYTLHQQVLLPEVGSFIVPRPSSTVVFVVCADGSVAKVETVDWTVTKIGTTDSTDPVAAVLGTSGDYLFIADSNHKVYKVSTSDFSTVAEATVDGGVNGMCSTVLGEVFVSPAGKSEVWAIDCGTGQHSRTFSVPYPSSALAVTSSGKYMYATVPGHGFAVVNTVDNTLEAVIDGFGDPVDIAINNQTTRALICTADLFILQR